MDKRIVLVKIDDESIKKVGRWPFPRVNYAYLLDKLKKHGAKTVAFNIHFAEDSLDRSEVSDDQMFANSISNFLKKPGNSVILPYHLTSNVDKAFESIPEELYRYSLPSKSPKYLELELTHHFIDKTIYPISSLVGSGADLAHSQGIADLDGIIRHYGSVAHSSSLYIPSLALSTYINHTGHSQPTIVLGESDDYSLGLRTGLLPLNRSGESKIRWLGGAANFPSVSFSKVLDSDDDEQGMKDLFEGNIVYIGSTATAAHGMIHSPIDSTMPGVFYHMNMTNMLLDGNFFKPLNKSANITLMLLLCGVLLFLLAQYFNSAIVDIFFLLGSIALTLALDFKYLSPQGYDLKLFGIFLGITACYWWSTLFRIYRSRQK